ncbi:MAG: N-acetylmuramoyl-L-alanine amidase [Anaerolineales bacterium]|nr:N-acetylmuramoyl-L-alanine amidase [Anaerolineales bacterium]
MQRIFILVFLLALTGIGIIVARTAGIGAPDANGLPLQGVVGGAWGKHIALISGHAGYDSGAVCEDESGQATIREADINAKVAELAAERLRRAGATVEILREFDALLDDLKVDAMLSIHADSCIDETGYKAAYYSGTQVPELDDELLACIDQKYPAATGLAHHPNTVTHDMTEYHAFRQINPQTPAAIIELGFLGGDHELLVYQPELPAKGVADSLICFLAGNGKPTN